MEETVPETSNSLRVSQLDAASVTALSGMGGAHLEAVTRMLGEKARPNRVMAPADRVLLTLVALRTNLTERALAALFGVSQSTVHRVIAGLLPRLAELLDDHWPDGPEHLMVDGTLIPVHDHQRTAKSKNYRRSVNAQIVATTGKRVVTVGAARPGNRNDIVVFRETITPPGGALLLADGAYRSAPETITPPPRSQPRKRRRHIQVRARIEHVIARLKDWQILRQCRRKGNAIDHALRAVAFLYNLRLDHPPRRN